MIRALGEARGEGADGSDLVSCYTSSENVWGFQRYRTVAVFGYEIRNARAVPQAGVTDGIFCQLNRPWTTTAGLKLTGGTHDTNFGLHAPAFSVHCYHSESSFCRHPPFSTIQPTPPHPVPVSSVPRVPLMQSSWL